MGFGNTAADVAGVLVGVAQKVYLSHRSGAIVVRSFRIPEPLQMIADLIQLPRWIDGKPVDHIRTYRKGVFLEQLSRYAPGLWTSIMNSVILGLGNKLYKLRPEWRFDPAPSINQARPIISDNLVQNLVKGDIISLNPIRQFLGGKTVELTDGTHVEVDSIIWCTGYTVDYSILGKSSPLPSRTNGIKSANGRAIPRLYQNILSLEHPESLAFMGNLSFMNPAFLMFDLATMALAQIWKGQSRLPSEADMRLAVDEQHRWIASLAQKCQVTPGLVKGADWLDWVDEAAGLRMKENLGYGIQGWKFWLKDREFCNTLMDGLLLPFHYRLFDGKRKRWEGAREAIIKTNRELAERKW